MRTLLIEDNKSLVKALKQGLEEEGIAVDVAYDGQVGCYKAESTNYDAIILDLVLPKEDGLWLLQRWRLAGLKTHVLVLTARDRTEDKVRGLDMGADDYLTKPFQLEELLARLRSLARRGHEVKSPIIHCYDLVIDTTTHTVRRNGKDIALTSREYSLLEILAFHRGHVVSRSIVWKHLYNANEESHSNVVEVYIRHLRIKIDKGFTLPLILTRWGVGYLLRG